MEHYTMIHTSNIICRDWLKNKCSRTKCWYRHSHSQPASPVQSVPTAQDFPTNLPPSQPPLQAQAGASMPYQNPAQNQLEVQRMITQMAMQMNTMELNFSESRKQMHILQEMLARSSI